jgi:hypothetical protein
MNRENPYNEERDEFGVIKRTFYETTDSDEFVWHKDKKDRLVTPVTETDWMIQFDNELPRKMVIGESIEIPKESYHRVIKGSGDLIVEIEEFDSIDEAKKKKSSGKKDACYYKVKSRYDVWPSAYGSGALVQCRKVGAKNWGNKTKEGLEENKQEFQNRVLELALEDLEIYETKQTLYKEDIKSRLKTLNEISSTEAYDKFYANLFDRENPDNDRLIYNKIIQLDPTFKPQTDKLGMYTKWLFRKDNVELLKNTKDEDLYKIKNDLEFFHNAKTKNLLPSESKDINKFNIKTLLDLIFDMQKSGEDLMSKTEKEKEIKSEVDKYELDDWTVIVPKTEEASCYYGKGTRWCTAADNNNMFDTYSYDGPLYILIGNHDKSDKYQFHFESSQFMDAKDNPINLSEFMNDNSDVYEFFNGRVGGNLDFEIVKSSLENYDEYGFQDFYSDDFTDKQKAELIRLAFDQDEYSESFYNVSNVLNYVDYPNMKSDFRNSFIWGLEASLGNSYDEENYEARMFIDYLGGFNSENISTIVKATDLKDVDQINKLFEIASEYNGEKLLSDYLENEDVNINIDMLKTIGDIKDKFNYSDSRKTVESDLVTIRFNSFDLENGTINITIVPKDENKEPISDKAESGNIKYQNLIKYLTSRQLFNEAKKNRKLTAKPSSEKNLGDWFARKGGKGKSKEGLEENKQEFQDRALDKINKVGGFDKLPDIDKLALLGGTNDNQLKALDLGEIFKENGGTFGKLEIKIRVKDINQQPINHKFSKEFAGKEGYLYPYINYTENGEPYIKVRFDEFISNPDYKGGGSYEERPIFLANIYPIDYDEIKSDFVKYQNNVDQDRSDFLSQFGLDEGDVNEVSDYMADLLTAYRDIRVVMSHEAKINFRPTPIDKQNIGSKPKGFWYGFGDSWLQWVKGEMPHWERDHIHIVKINKNRVLRISSYDELVAFTDEYGSQTSGIDPNYVYIDWAKVAEKYAGIEINPYISKARMSMMWYYPWDVASGCIWGEDGIVSIELFDENTDHNNYPNVIDDDIYEVYDRLSEKTDYSKEASKGLHGWFERQGGKGKSKGWVDCNTCRTDKKTGRKKCKPCGRKEGEERSKYPACRPTPSACGTKGKGKKWGKKSVNENVDKQTINSFLSDFGFFITLNLAKVQSEAKNDDAKNKLAEMQSNLNKFSKNYTELIDPTKNKNLYEPKVLSQIIGQIGKYINYIKPHIETLVKDSDIKNAWLQKIQKLSNMYSTIIGKPNENRVDLIKNMLNENSEMLDVVEVFSIYNSNSVHTVEPDVKPVDVPTKPVEKPKTDSPYAPSIRPKTKPKAIK